MPPGRLRAEKPACWEVILGNEGPLLTRHPRNTVKFTMRQCEGAKNKNLIPKRPDREHLGPAATISPRFNSDRI